MSGARSFENFDPHFCGVATKVAAAVCVLFLAITLAVLFTIDLSLVRSALPRLFATDHAATEFFKATVFLQAGVAAGLTWISATWATHAQRLVDQLDQAKRDLLLPGPPLENYSLVLILDLNKLFVCVLIGFVCFGSIPLIAIVAASLA